MKAIRVEWLNEDYSSNELVYPGGINLYMQDELHANIETIVQQVDEQAEDALRVYRENQESNSPDAALAYDRGRVAGLREALDIIRKTAQDLRL